MHLDLEQPKALRRLLVALLDWCDGLHGLAAKGLQDDDEMMDDEAANDSPLAVRVRARAVRA